MKATFNVTFKGPLLNSNGTPKKEIQVVYTKIGFSFGNVIHNTYVFKNDAAAEEWIQKQHKLTREINSQI